jgi:hypothetical protein
MKKLLQIRREQEAFIPGSGQKVILCDDRVLALMRAPQKNDRVLCVQNVSNDELELNVPLNEIGEKEWKSLLEEKELSVNGCLKVKLKPYEVMWAG